MKKKVNSRRKGHGFERWVANDLRENLLFPNALRQLEYQENEANGVDLKGTSPFPIQCKVGKQVPQFYYDVLKKMKVNELDFKTVIAKRDREKPLVVMDYEDWKELVRHFLFS
jgi:hypothetical protein